MPEAWAKAFPPTTALLGWTGMPVCRETSALTSARRVVSMPVRSPSDFSRVRRIITTSSREALPARSPMPLIVHSTRRGPPQTAGRLFFLARARAVLQGTPITAWSEVCDVFPDHAKSAPQPLGEGYDAGVGVVVAR